MKILITVLLLCSITTFGQVTGVVKDSLTQKPIPYVSIWVENENNGTTSEENGEFKLTEKAKDKNLIFSAVGFEKKKVKASKITEILLKPIDYQLDEVIVINSLGTKQRIIGQTENTILQAFDNGPRIDTKFFPYDPSYKKTKYIKQIAIKTDNALEKATLKIHLYRVDEAGFPADELLHKDLLITVNKGTTTTKIDLTKYQLKLPKSGIFVGIEKLIIESNKWERTTISYQPLVLYNRVDRDFLYTYSGGKWKRTEKQANKDSLGRMMIYEPAILLILTN